MSMKWHIIKNATFEAERSEWFKKNGAEAVSEIHGLQPARRRITIYRVNTFPALKRIVYYQASDSNTVATIRCWISAWWRREKWNLETDTTRLFLPGGSPYFLPRWIGALDFVLGEGAAAEMNLAYFNNTALDDTAPGLSEC